MIVQLDTGHIVTSKRSILNPKMTNMWGYDFDNKCLVYGWNDSMLQQEVSPSVVIGMTEDVKQKLTQPTSHVPTLIIQPPIDTEQLVERLSEQISDILFYETYGHLPSDDDDPSIQISKPIISQTLKLLIRDLPKDIFNYRQLLSGVLGGQLWGMELEKDNYQPNRLNRPKKIPPLEVIVNRLHSNDYYVVSRDSKKIVVIPPTPVFVECLFNFLSPNHIS